MTGIKQKLYEQCESFLDRRIASATEAIRSAQTSANEETKSSAGDKYETGRAMAQLEIEKNSVQLEEARKEKKLLASINIALKPASIQTGSLVITNHGNFFIAISVGVVVLDGTSYAVVSTLSPIGKLLLGKKNGDSFSFGSKAYTITRFE
jgi:transcription elongation GreA/GreB family factor